MVAFSGHKDLAYGTVVTPPSPASSGTSLSLSVADAGLMPTTLPFYATAAPASTLPTHANAEVVKVTNVNLGTGEMTIVRAQGGSTAQSIAAGWQFFASVSSEWADEIEGEINTIVSTAVFDGDGAGGDLTGTYPNPSLATIGAAAGPIGDSTHVAAVTIDAKGRVTGLTSVAIAGGPPSGAAGGDLAGTYPDPTLAVIGSATGPIGDATHVPAVTIDAKGRVTGLTSVSIQIAESQVTNLTTDLAAKVDKATFDANTILKADSDDTPVALTLAANTFPARASSGAILAKTVTDAALGVLDDASVTAMRTTLQAQQWYPFFWLPNMYISAASGALTRAAVPAFPAYNETYVTNHGLNDYVTWLLPVSFDAGTYSLTLFSQQASNAAIWTIDTSTDGSSWTSQGTWDAYKSGGSVYTEAVLSGLTFAAGTKYLRVTAASKNASSSSYYLEFGGFSILRTA